MRACVSSATTMPTPFAEDVAAFAEAGCPAMEVWLTKLEKHLETTSAAVTRQLLSDKGVSLVAGAYQGGLLLSQGEARKSHFDHFRSRLDLCQQFGIGTMLVVADFTQSIDPQALERAVVSLAQAAQWADGFGVKLALEFRGRNTFCSSLDTAVRIVRACEQPNVGLCFDVFHYYTGPSKIEDLDAVRGDEIAFAQVCDVSAVPREVAADSDRILPGDGEWKLTELLARLRQIGYDGWVSCELMNPMLWQAPPGQVVGLAYESVRRVLPS